MNRGLTVRITCWLSRLLGGISTTAGRCDDSWQPERRLHDQSRLLTTPDRWGTERWLWRLTKYERSRLRAVAASCPERLTGTDWQRPTSTASILRAGGSGGVLCRSRGWWLIPTSSYPRAPTKVGLCTQVSPILYTSNCSVCSTFLFYFPLTIFSFPSLLYMLYLIAVIHPENYKVWRNSPDTGRLLLYIMKNLHIDTQGLQLIT